MGEDEALQHGTEFLQSIVYRLERTGDLLGFDLCLDLLYDVEAFLEERRAYGLRGGDHPSRTEEFTVDAFPRMTSIPSRVNHPFSGRFCYNGSDKEGNDTQRIDFSQLLGERLEFCFVVPFFCGEGDEMPSNRDQAFVEGDELDRDLGQRFLKRQHDGICERR